MLRSVVEILLATNGVEVQAVRSGVIYAVGSFSAQMCPAKAASLKLVGGCYFHIIPCPLM